MYYGAIKNCDIANGPGVRISLFVSGCRNRCPGCFQPETRDFQHGQPFTQKTQEYLLELLAPNHIDGLTVLGGEPMEPENQTALLPFIQECRARYPRKNIWVYTGYTLERAPRCPATEAFLRSIDILVDGPFIEAEKRAGLWFRGSANQRIIKMPETLEAHRIVTLTPRDRGRAHDHPETSLPD